MYFLDSDVCINLLRGRLPLARQLMRQSDPRLFGIPAVRGVSFGTGFAAAGMRGSVHNDPFIMEDGRVRTRTNHAGGVLGGITSGMPLVVNIAVKPTASISREQETVDLETKESAPLVIHGRHDPCIVPRAVPVAEAVTALTVLDMMLE